MHAAIIPLRCVISLAFCAILSVVVGVGIEVGVELFWVGVGIEGWVTGNRSGQVNEVTSELHLRGPGQGFLCCGWLKLEIL